ncbi:DUF6204 family protein [Micromonospora sp. HUAS LYJ1]|nr:DUF6204 family protein [Micromonospora sp. HUAS LYJ1]WKU08512.1 DUF6204 family protein [Micromonospora sp. HUAS LYJ1]
MTTGKAGKSYQVIVRGRFAPLADEQRAALLARVDEHGAHQAKFTEEGIVTYERSLLGFTFRCLVPATEADGAAVVTGRAEALAAAAVAELGAGHRDLTSVSTDLADIKIRQRARS